MFQQSPLWWRTAAAGATLAALGVTASACGADHSSLGSSPAITSGSTAASSAASVPDSTAGGDAFAPGSKVDVASVKKMFADAIGSASTVHVEMKMTGQVTMTGSGDMDMKARPVKASLRLASSTLQMGDIRMLMLDNAMYLKTASLGTKYMKVSTTDKDSPLSRMGLQSLDPSAMFDRFGDAITGGTYVGKETVDGTATDHYRLTVDTSAVASALPSGAASAAAGGAAMPDTETMDVWFDGDGRYKQMRMTVGAQTVSESFSDWGKPVAITAPPAGQVQDLSKAMSGAS